MIVVSDTSPLAYLVAIGVVDALPELYGRVLIPQTVAAELLHPHGPASQWMAHAPAWLTIVAPRQVPPLPDLDRGEQEAIALALEQGARLLIDERAGRAAAQQLGLQIAGTLAVIVDGAQRGYFDGLTALDRLSATNFYASEELLDSIRRLMRK